VIAGFLHYLACNPAPICSLCGGIICVNSIYIYIWFFRCILVYIKIFNVVGNSCLCKFYI
jgi:hypothetical protein